ncbi:MAG: transporter permease [Herbinix sp.]|jgi:putative aldouronate transport system permease protein|nr:transporter permease [Herbinix sp.]
MQKKRRALKNELSTPQKVAAGIILLIIFIIMIIPMWNAFVVSTSTALSSTQSGMKLWWDDFSFEGYQYVYKVTKLLRPFLNSFFVTSVGVVSQVVLSAFAGYVLIQKDLPLKKFITSFIMLTMMIPGDLTLISIYQMNKQLNLLNSYTGLIVNGLISGFSILLMRNYFTSVPYSLAESGRIDGASELRIFAGIYLPISKPGLATVFFMEYVAKWNSIMLPATLITDQNKYTLPLMLKAMIMQDNSTSGTAFAPENAVMATIIISTIPLLLIYIFAQRYLLAGMNLGASKE